MTNTTGLIWIEESDAPPVYVPSGEENVRLLVDTMTRIDEHPEDHDQDTWLTRRHCGTKACYAGTALLLAGWTPHFDNDGDEVFDDYEDVASYFDSPKGGRFYARDGAVQELGITRQQAEHLFSTYRSIHELRIAVAQLTKGVYTPPEEP